MTPSGTTGPVTFAQNGSLPPGLSLSNAGVLAGTPETSGFYFISFAITDNTGTVYRGASLGVFDIHITTPAELPNAIQDVPYSTQIVATGGTPPYQFAASSLPDGLFLDPATGAISGTVKFSVGPYRFDVTVTDAGHVSYSKTMMIDTIGVPPRLPSIAPYGNDWDDCTFGVHCGLGISVWGGGAAPFSWSAIGLPAGLSIRFGSDIRGNWPPPGDAYITGVPTAIGTFPVQVTVTDAEGVTATNIFPIRISRLMAQEYQPDGTINEPYSSRIRVIGGTPPYTGEIISGRLPAGVSFDAGTFQFSGTPIENGFFNIRLRFTDAAGNTVTTSRYFQIGAGTSTIYVNNSDLGTALIGQSFGYQLSACCVPTPYTWSLVGGSLPDGLTLSSDGLIAGTVASSNAPREYAFLVRAADSINPANAGVRQLTITVTSLSITTFTLPVGNVGTPYNGSALGLTLTASGGSGVRTWRLAPFNYLPLGLTLSSDGVLSGTPAGPGQFNFGVYVSDTGGNFAWQWFNVSIYPAGVYPPLGLNIGTNFTSRLGVFQLPLSQGHATGGLGPYQFSLTPAADLPPGADGEVDGLRMLTDESLSGFFGPEIMALYGGVIAAPGVYRPSIRLTDSRGTYVDRMLTITVPSFTLISEPSLPSATVNVPYSFTPETYGGSGNHSWHATGLPSGLSMDPSSGQITGTPAAAGFFSARVSLTDLTTSAFVPTTFYLNVDPFAIATNGVLSPGVVGVPYAANLSAPNCAGVCTWDAYGLPSWLSLSADGLLSGTPTGSFNGSIIVVASGSNGTAVKGFSLVVVNSIFPVLMITNTDPLDDVTVGESAVIFLSAQGGAPPYDWTVESGSLPGGVALVSSGNAVASYVAPTAYLFGRAMQPGVHTFTLRVTDHAGAFVTKTFTINVSRLYLLSSFLPIFVKPLVYNQPYTQPLLVLGGRGSYPTWTSSPMPPGLVLGANTGVVSGTPSNTGSFGSTIRVEDSAGNSLRARLSFYVSGPTDITLDIPLTNATVQQGLPATLDVTPTNGTAPYIVTALTPLPPGLILASGSDFIVGGPAPGRFALTGVPLAAGTYDVTLQARDSAPVPNVGVKTITITVTTAAVFTTLLPDGSVGVPYTQPLVAFDAAGPATWSLVAGSAMPPGLSLLAAGGITGTPTARGAFLFALNVSFGVWGRLQAHFHAQHFLNRDHRSRRAAGRDLRDALRTRVHRNRRTLHGRVVGDRDCLPG